MTAADHARATRAAQGLPEFIEDPDALLKLAALLDDAKRRGGRA